MISPAPSPDPSPIVALRGPVASAPPFATVAEALAARAGSARPWLTFHRGSRCEELAGESVWALACGWAEALRAAGVRRGDRVAVLQPNGAGFVGAFFGAGLTGAVPVPLAWPIADGIGPQLSRIAPLIAAAAPRAIAAPATVAALGGLGAPVVSEPRPVSSPSPSSAGLDLDPLSPAFIQFTSGTTSAPRGVVISHRAAMASAWAMGEALGLDEHDVGLSWLPLFHDMGLVGTLLSSLVRGFPVHILTPAEFLLHPDRWLLMVGATRATLTVAPNFGYEVATRRVAPDRLDLSSLRCALDGSEPVLRATLDGFERRFARAGLRPGTVLPVYGLAENTLGVCFAEPGAARGPDLTWLGRRVPSVGRPLPGMEVAIRTAGGAAAADGAEGEILVRGPSLMSGYHEDETATAAVLRGGWLCTGDLGVATGGQLYVTGREKDLVIKGGQKFHPYDIERLAAEVVDAPPGGVAAFARANARTGTEDLVLVVELRRRSDGDVERLLRGHLMSQLGVRVDRVHVVGAGTLPRTTSGKVRRCACREQFGDVK